jgi:hypothetical protein
MDDADPSLVNKEQQASDAAARKMPKPSKR